jgi:cytochrome c peroxidase
LTRGLGGATCSAVRISLAVALALALGACRAGDARLRAGARVPPWEAANPVRPLPTPPLGSPADFGLVPWVTPEKARLGRWLFYDPRLSADGTLSCATCHRPENAFSEPLPVSSGIRAQLGRRKSQPIVNAAFRLYPVWFWDGRATTLAEQVHGPIESAVEMGNTLAGAVRAVRRAAGYAPYFREAFGDETIDIDRIAEAIAAYEATRLSGNSRFDRYDAGDAWALSPREVRGKELFFGRAQCSQCHLGPNLTDDLFHNLGVGWRAPPPGADPADGFADKGRYEVTGDHEDMGAFKTPTLREVSRRAPYMHDGSVADLWDAVLHYWRGGTPNPWLSERMEPIPLGRADVAALVAFMEAPDGEGYEDVAPASFPP